MHGYAVHEQVPCTEAMKYCVALEWLQATERKKNYIIIYIFKKYLNTPPACTYPIMHPICPSSKFCISIGSISLGTAVIPRRNKNKGYAIFFRGGGAGRRGANKVQYGRCVSGVYKICTVYRDREGGEREDRGLIN